MYYSSVCSGFYEIPVHENGIHHSVQRAPINNLGKVPPDPPATQLWSCKLSIDERSRGPTWQRIVEQFLLGKISQSGNELYERHAFAVASDKLKQTASSCSSSNQISQL